MALFLVLALVSMLPVVLAWSSIKLVSVLVFVSVSALVFWTPGLVGVPFLGWLESDILSEILL